MINKPVIEVYTIRNSGVYALYLYDKHFDFEKKLNVQVKPENIKKYLDDNFPNYEVIEFEFTKEEIEDGGC